MVVRLSKVHLIVTLQVAKLVTEVEIVIGEKYHINNKEPMSSG